MGRSLLLGILSLAIFFPYGSVAQAPTWPSSADELEDLMFLNNGYRARGFSAGVVPCGSGLGPGRSTAAEIIRTTFHDMATYSYVTRLGGIDASLIYELSTTGENVGAAFPSTLSMYASFFKPGASMSDLIALGTYTAVRACGGPAIPVRYGRIDAVAGGSSGVPQPQNALSTFQNQFSRMGFNNSEMIQLIACGHTIGRVHVSDNPLVLDNAPSGNATYSVPMDSSEGSFDERIASEYVAGTTKNPLVVNRRYQRDSDNRIFKSDNNATIKAMAVPATFRSTCATVMQKMMDTVPGSVTLSASALQPYEVKPSRLRLYLLDGGQSSLFSGEIRVRTTSRSVSSIQSVQVVYKDRTGNTCDGCKISTQYTGAASGFDDTFAFFKFSSPISATSSISSFTVTITSTSGTTQTFDNNGSGFPMQDNLLHLYPQSCLSSSTSMTIYAAVRDTVSGVSPTVNVVTKVPRSQYVVPSLATSAAAMGDSVGTVGSYRLHKISVALDSASSSTAMFNITATSGSTTFTVPLQNAADLPSTCGTLSPTSSSSSARSAYQGCYTDSVGKRALTGAASANTTGMTAELCAASCSQFQYFGVEYSTECYCGNTRDASSTQAAETDCNMACAGDSSQFCGGAGRISLYSNPAYSAPAASAFPGYAYAGCYSDTPGARSLSDRATTSNSMSIEACGTFCDGSNYFGVEYGQECYCGSSLSSASVVKPEGDCSMLCAGNSTEYCGAGNRLNVYNSTSTRTTTTTTTSPTSMSTNSASTPTLAGYDYVGCYTDSVGSRTFSARGTTSSTMNYTTCATYCGSYDYIGLEYSAECYCGSSLPSASAQKPQSDCNMRCSGDASSYCGAGDRLTVFKAKSPVAQPGNPSNITGYSYTGCYTDSTAARSLTNRAPISGDLTIEKCAAACLAGGYAYMGTEYSGECYCDNTIANSSSVADASGCSMTCSGNGLQLCGGPDRLSLYTATS